MNTRYATEDFLMREGLWSAPKKSLNLLIVLAFTCLIGIGWVASRVINEVAESDYWQEHTHEVILELNQLLSALKDAETGQRGFLVTGQDNYLAPYEAALGRIGRHLEVLKRLTADNPVQQERLAELSTLSRDRLAVLKQGIELRREQGFTAAQEMVLSERGKSLMDTIRTQVAEAEALEQGLLHERTQEKTARARQTIRILSAAGLVSGSLLAIVLFLLRREIDDRERIAEELKQHQINLEGMIQNRTAALRQSEARLQTLIDHAPAALAMFDRDMRYLAASRRWREDYGIKEGELLNRSHYEVFPEITERWRDAHRRGLAGEVLRGEAERFKRADGSVQWVTWEIRPWHDDREAIGGIVIFAEEVTARMQAQEEVRRSRELLKLITDAVPALISYIDADYRYRLVNLGYQRWFNRSAGEIVGQSVREVLGEAAWERVHPWMARALAGEDVSYEEELPYREGGPRWVMANYAPDHDETGQIRGIVVLVTDISARVAAAEAIRRMNAELEARVEARTADLKAANRELETFAYAVSHDLRSPLRAISGFTRILARDYRDRLDKTGQHYLEQVTIGASRMGELIDGLLQLSRSSRGDFMRQRVDLSALASRLLAEFAAADPERHVQCDVEPGLAVDGDPRMLEALMRNLLDNAWKYTARTADARVRVYADRSAEPPRYCIADNGAGFDMAHAGQLFQPFKRLHTQSEFAGIGIGLATVQRIVHRHGGEISAQAAPGEGAMFCFTLPSSTDPSEPNHLGAP